jgi:hypothetical protein
MCLASTAEAPGSGLRPESWPINSVSPDILSPWASSLRKLNWHRRRGRGEVKEERGAERGKEGRGPSGIPT